MNNREQIVAIARGWLNTPFIHQGRIKGKGCDCLGLIMGVGEEAEIKLADKPIKYFDETNYPSLPNGALLKQKLDNILNIKPKNSAQAGDIFLMNFGNNPQHLGIFSDYVNSTATLAIIHCYSQTGKVVEHRLNKFWYSKIEQVYSIVD